MPVGKVKKLLRTPEHCEECGKKESDVFYLYRCCNKLYCDVSCQAKNFALHTANCPSVRLNNSKRLYEMLSNKIVITPFN